MSLFVGSLNFFALVGASVSPKVSDALGRRFSFVLTSIMFIFGVSIQSVAGTFKVLMFGRCILGMAVGLGLAIDPLYIAEVTPPFLRGKLVSYSEIAVNVGILLGFLVGFIFEGLPEGKVRERASRFASRYC